MFYDCAGWASSRFRWQSGIWARVIETNLYQCSERLIVRMIIGHWLLGGGHDDVRRCNYSLMSTNLITSRKWQYEWSNLQKSAARLQEFVKISFRCLSAWYRLLVFSTIHAYILSSVEPFSFFYYGLFFLNKGRQQVKDPFYKLELMMM